MSPWAHLQPFHTSVDKRDIVCQAAELSHFRSTYMLLSITFHLAMFKRSILPSSQLKYKQHQTLVLLRTGTLQHCWKSTKVRENDVFPAQLEVKNLARVLWFFFFFSVLDLKQEKHATQLEFLFGFKSLYPRYRFSRTVAHILSS